MSSKDDSPCFVMGRDAPAAEAAGRQTLLASRPYLIYLAGPYTYPDPVENTHNTIRIADALLDLGVIPVVPHLTMFWHLLRPRPYEDWLEYDLQVMARCDVVLRIPGESHGADREVNYAYRLGMPVVFAESTHPRNCTATLSSWFNEQTD